MTRSIECGQRGAASLLAIALVVLGLALAIGAARFGAALVTRARAETAADAAALAAADRLAYGADEEDATVAARATAAANGGRLLACICRGRAAEVTVEVSAPLDAGLGRPARARARAEVGEACSGDRSCAPATTP